MINPQSVFKWAWLLALSVLVACAGDPSPPVE